MNEVAPHVVVHDEQFNLDVSPLTPARYSLRRRVAAGIAGAVAAVCVLSVDAGEVYADDPGLALHMSVGYFSEQGPGPVPTGEQEHVEALLDTSTPPELLAINGDTLSLAVEASAWDTATLPNAQEYCLQQAGKYGLRLADYVPYMNELASTRSVPQVLEVLNEFTANYGFKVTLATQKTIPDIGNDIVTLDSEPDFQRFLFGAEAFMRGLFPMPIQVSHYIHTREVRLVASFGEQHSSTSGEFDPNGWVNEPSHVVYLPIDNFYSGDSETTIHEFGHEVDYQESGYWGMRRDAQFQELNDPGFRYGDVNSPYFSRDVMGTYFGSKVIEDKAGLYSGMLNGINPTLAYSPSPVIREKYRLLLARLDEHIPGIAAYLTAISSHDPADVPIIACQ